MTTYKLGDTLTIRRPKPSSKDELRIVGWDVKRNMPIFETLWDYETFTLDTQEKLDKFLGVTRA